MPARLRIHGRRGLILMDRQPVRRAMASRCFVPPDDPPTRDFLYSSSCAVSIDSSTEMPRLKKLRSNHKRLFHGQLVGNRVGCN